MITDTQSKYAQLLKNISNELDISPSKYEEAKNRYEAVGAWLEQINSNGNDSPPQIYVQGSFRLGTVIRPHKEETDPNYDIDLICELPNQKGSSTPSAIKSVVGDRLKSHSDYQRMLDKEGKRCWTLNYAEKDRVGFHMDILPCLAEDDLFKTSLNHQHGIPSNLADKAIALTEKRQGNYLWKASNPEGFAQWFDNRKEPVLRKIEKEQRQVIFENNQTIYASIEDVPIQLIKTPLQVAIQLLKRHRDIRFSGTEWEEDKPISMIITYLSAKLYQGQEDIIQTLKFILESLDYYSPLCDSAISNEDPSNDSPLILRKKSGEWHIPNPVNPGENFADRWEENNQRKAKAFFRWVAWARNDFVQTMNEREINRIGFKLENIFGSDIISKASKGIYTTASMSTAAAPPSHHVQMEKPIRPWADNE